MAAFTPINGTNVIANAHSAYLTPQNVERELVNTTSSSTHHQSVASGYLGRGNTKVADTPLKQHSGPLRGRGIKKATNRGKMASVDDASEPPAKRPKMSQLSDSTRIGKVSGDDKRSASTTTASKVSYGGTESEARYSDVLNPRSSSSTSVVFPSTSMSSAQATPPQTSVDAIRCASGYGATLYDCSGMSGEVQEQPNMGSVKPLESHRSDYVPMSISKGILHDDEQNGLPKASAASDESQQKALGDVATPAEEDYFDTESDDEEAWAALFDLVAAQHSTLSHPSLISSESCRNTAEAMTGDKESRKPALTLTPEEDLVDLPDMKQAELDELMQATEARLQQPDQSSSWNLASTGSFTDLYGSSGSMPPSQDQQGLLDTPKPTQVSIATPIVRMPFPSSIPDRSAIYGASSSTLLRTCFRVGEALNAGAQGVRAGQNVILELYARVVSSYRVKKVDGVQHFVFHDLYHDRPPHVEGTFELWRESVLWNADSSVFLKPRPGGIMCRVIARMKRDAETERWRLEVLNVWEADWEDVEHVAGIYARNLADGDA